MILTEITLINWRNHSLTNVKPSPKLNLILGPNGSGKTNLAEAIGYLSLGKTWRGLSLKEIIKDNEDSAHLKASVYEGNLLRKLEFNIKENSRTILLNNKPIKRLSDLAKVGNVITFSPKNTSIFIGPPADRRDFLDIIISKEDPTHIKNLNAFLKVLKERNAVLKEEIINESYLDILTEKLIELQKPIIQKRASYLERLATPLKEVASKIFSKERDVKISYSPFLQLEASYEEKARNIYKESIRRDKASGNTLLGIHKEDFTLLLDGKDVGTYGSQGENRILALALHLAPYFLTKEEDKKPIVVLDDVYSELDETHAANLSSLLSKMGQVFVTATNLNLPNASIIEVNSKLP